MTTDFDKEIVKAAFNVKEARRMNEPLAGPLDLLARAFEAKDEALRPKLLTADAAVNIFWKSPSMSAVRDMQAVLDADRAAVLEVIEALPRSAHANRRPDGRLEVGDERVSINDIRRALGDRA